MPVKPLVLLFSDMNIDTTSPAIGRDVSLWWSRSETAVNKTQDHFIHDLSFPSN
jgi:hypothetical protein